MTRRRDLIVLLFFLLCFALFIYLFFGLMTPQTPMQSLSLTRGDKVGLVEIIGPIYDSQPILEQLDRVAQSSVIKALVVRLETPGGGVAAAQEVYQRLTYLRNEKQLPIIASMGGVAASGGYYIALGADTIIANPGSITGSIGVIIELPYHGRLLDKIGVGVETVKSGKLKDAGSPHRQKPMTVEEKAYFQSLIDDSYQQFLSAVAQERGMELEQVEALADGRVFTGRQAQETGLVDLLGSCDDAVRIAGQSAGIKGEPEVVEIPRKKLTMLDLLLGDVEQIVYLRWGWGISVRYLLNWSTP